VPKTLITVCPHAGWDGVIAGLRGLLIIRDAGRPHVRAAAWLGRDGAAGPQGGVDGGRDLRDRPAVASLADHALHAALRQAHRQDGARQPGLTAEAEQNQIACLRIVRQA
jgi:hypothetical protein